MTSEAQAQAPLAGVVLCCSALSAEDRDRVHQITRELGGRITFDLTVENTHLIIANTQTPKYRYVAKERPDLVVLLPSFIDEAREVWMTGAVVDIKALEVQHRAPTLHGLIITLTGFSDVEERAAIIREIQNNGATYDGDLSKHVTTHLIAKVPSGKKYTTAPSWGVRVVAIEWLYQSAERGMCLDEALFSLKTPPEERGEGAWNRNYAARSNSLKRPRDEDQASLGDGRRKIRRTLSTKMSIAQDSIWADITAAPAPKVTKDDWKDDADSAIVDQKTKGNIGEPLIVDNSKTTKTLTKVNGRLFDQFTIYLHNFKPIQEVILRDHLSSNGAKVQSTESFSNSGATQADNNALLMCPREVILDEQSLPSLLKNSTRVTEWWLETCIHERRYAMPTESPLMQPFFKGKIPGFENLVMCLTGITGTSRLQLSRVVEQLGAKFDETITQGVSVLLSLTKEPRKDKVKAARKLGVTIVSADWLWKCAESQSLQPYGPYLIGSEPTKTQTQLTTYPNTDSMSFTTTKTLSVPSEDVEKRVSERSRSIASKASAASTRHNARAPASPVIVEESHTLSMHPLQDQENNTMASHYTTPSLPAQPKQISQPLQELAPERLNSPSKQPSTKSSSPEKATEEPSSKPDHITNALTEMLAAKRAARQASSEDTTARRKRSGLGRAASNNLEVARSPPPQDLEEDEPLAKMLLSQKLVYEDHDTRMRHERLLEEMNGGKKEDEGVRRSKRTPARKGKKKITG